MAKSRPRFMDTKPAERDAAGLPRYAVKFPYVNGQLFSGSTDVPRFSKVARSYLAEGNAAGQNAINGGVDPLTGLLGLCNDGDTVAPTDLPVLESTCSPRSPWSVSARPTAT